jgi:bifunctional non-homologous end joining protein LigD
MVRLNESTGTACYAPGRNVFSVEVSNADRIVFPDDGITKGEVVAYYQAAAERMLPFMASRALSVERYPKGIGEKGFMQKNAPDHFTDELIGRHEVPK